MAKCLLLSILSLLLSPFVAIMVFILLAPLVLSLVFIVSSLCGLGIIMLPVLTRKEEGESEVKDV